MPRPYGKDLYLISAGELIKVGRSCNTARRLLEIQRSMPFANATLLATFPEQGFLEPFVFKALGEYQRRGEWLLGCSGARAIEAVGACLSAL